MSEPKLHIERPDIERMGEYAGGDLMPHDSYHAEDLLDALRWIKHLEEQLETLREALSDIVEMQEDRYNEVQLAEHAARALAAISNPARES